jgi:Fe-S-cluster containining protein
MGGNKQWVRVGKYWVDSRLLEKRPVARCLIGECHAACCSHGVYVDVGDATRIIDEAELIRPHLPADRWDESTWFEGGKSFKGAKLKDGDFPTGYKVGTNTLQLPQFSSGTRCVFLRDDNRCALQRAAIAQGRHPLDLKPFYCALFPIVVLKDTIQLDGKDVLEDTIQLDDENELFSIGGTCQRASQEPVALYKLFKDEMMLALGQEGYDDLCALAATDSGAA